MFTWPIDVFSGEPDSKTHAPSSDTAAVNTITPTSEEYVAIQSIEWSYDAVPTGGGIVITVDGSTVWSVDITAAGPGHFDWSMAPRVFADFAGGVPTKGDEVVVTLAAGGTGVTGKLNTRYL